MKIAVGTVKHKQERRRLPESAANIKFICFFCFSHKEMAYFLADNQSVLEANRE